MAQALRSGGTHIDATHPDSAERCRAGADEIERLLNVIRTRDKHIAELQDQLIGPPGPFVIGECVLMGDRTPEFEAFINEGKALALIEVPRDELRSGGALLFKTVRMIIDPAPPPVSGPDKAAEGKDSSRG